MILKSKMYAIWDINEQWLYFVWIIHTWVFVFSSTDLLTRISCLDAHNKAILVIRNFIHFWFIFSFRIATWTNLSRYRKNALYHRNILYVSLLSKQFSGIFESLVFFKCVFFFFFQCCLYKEQFNTWFRLPSLLTIY